MDAFERFLKRDERLLSLYLSPQGDHLALQPARLLEAIMLDHPLDTCEPMACFSVINWRHSISLPPAAGRKLSRTAQSGLDSCHHNVCYQAFLWERT